MILLLAVPQFRPHKFKPINFASIIDSSILCHFKIIETLTLNANTTNIKQAFRARKVIGTFEKRASEVKQTKIEKCK